MAGLEKGETAPIDPQQRCDICWTQSTTIIDGKTKRGPWAYMCPRCHSFNGVGLGEGRGQRFVSVDGKWIKDMG